MCPLLLAALSGIVGVDCERVGLSLSYVIMKDLTPKFQYDPKISTQSGMGELMTTGESVDYHRSFEDNLRATIRSKMAAQQSMYSGVVLPEAGIFMKDPVEDINNLMRNQPSQELMLGMFGESTSAAQASTFVENQLTEYRRMLNQYRAANH